MLRHYGRAAHRRARWLELESGVIGSGVDSIGIDTSCGFFVSSDTRDGAAAHQTTNRDAD